MEVVSPTAVILVFSDSKGDRLLYRYPYQKSTNTSNDHCKIQLNRSNPYALIESQDDLCAPPLAAAATVTSQKSLHLSDDELSTLFAVKPQLCNQKFELKINNVRFVSHPTLIQRKESNNNNGGGSGVGGVVTVTTQTVAAAVVPTAIASNSLPQQMLINIVFALQAQASYSIVKCYHALSKRLGLALKVEEQRTCYMSEETTQMTRTHDEMSAQHQSMEHIFDLVSERSSLAQALKTIYHDLCTTGLLNTTLKQNLTLCFCLPQKAHQLHKRGSIVDPEIIQTCLRSLKPFHGILLLVDSTELLDCVPPAGARMLLQLIEVYTPLMSLQSMSSDADMKLEHVYKLVSHLVYWAKATIIYPLCETNVYVIAPDAPLHTKSHLVDKFASRFPGMSLFEVIADFSLPTSIGHLTTPLQQPARQGILAQMVLWMLQHHLLLQLHTYVQFMPSDLNGDLESNLIRCNFNSEINVRMDEDDGDVDDDEGSVELGCMTVVDGGGVASAISISDNDDDDDLNAGSLMSMSSQPMPVPHTSRHSITDDHYSVEDCGSTASDNIIAQPCSSHKSNFSMTTSICSDNTESIASIEDEQKIKEFLQVFDKADRPAILRIPASSNVDDLALMVKLYQAGYFKSEHHLEEIMYFENLRRSQLLQLLDKFRDVLIIYETEGPAIATMYNGNFNNGVNKS